MNSVSISKIENGFLVTYYVPHFLVGPGEDTHKQLAYTTLNEALTFIYGLFTPTVNDLVETSPNYGGTAVVGLAATQAAFGGQGASGQFIAGINPLAGF